jgi:V/A-type H+/Na+-transporting ATPase subunit F
MSKIGIIGDADSVLGFKVFGLDAFACQTKEEAAKTLHHMVKDDYGIIYITEKYFTELEAEIAKYDSLRIPAIVTIPGIDGSYGVGQQNVKRAVEKAVGADILFGDK